MLLLREKDQLRKSLGLRGLLEAVQQGTDGRNQKRR
jgi:hypothetical protein